MNSTTRQLLRTASRVATRSALISRATATAPRFAAASAAASRQSSFLSRHYATSPTATSSVLDPQTTSAQEALDLGTSALEAGDLEAAEEYYKKSLEIKETAIGHYNLGVVQYQLSQLPASITSFQASLALTPSTVGPPTIPEDPNTPLPPLTPAQVVLADTHTNLGAAYILSTPPRPDKALEHLQSALSISPEDGEVCFNLAAVLEATGEEEEALVAYQRAEKLGIDRAKINIRNLGAKLLGKAREAEAKKAEEGGAEEAKKE